MASHDLELGRRTLHGHWSRDLPPAIHIEDGDTVRLRTLDAMWCAGRPTTWPWARFLPRVASLDDGHALTGPIHVSGASPGSVLEVKINALVPADWAWTWSWQRGARARDLGVLDEEDHRQLWDVDPKTMTARDAKGRTVKLRPFLGVIGVAPPEEGLHSTTPPRIWGGNLDCRELVAGTTLFLPIGIEGALLSVGDGHGAQGDGEVCGTAIECPMDRVELTLSIRRDMQIRAPIARIDGAWLTLGIGSTLEAASLMALASMLDIIQRQRGVSRNEALALASIAADLRITQVVNLAQGVHCILRDDAIG